MNEDLKDLDSVIIRDEDSYNKKIQSISKPEQNVGLDNGNNIVDKLITGLDNAQKSSVDMTALNLFTQVSTNRNQLYNVLDLMAQDSTISAVLETYAEDATEMNEEGKIIWAKSKHPEVEKFVNYLLKILQVDKNAYSWVYSLILYGDIYLQLFKQSEYDKDIFKKGTIKDKLEPRNRLNEDLKVNKYSINDHYVEYLEAVENPACMFELTRFGKTSGYIQTENVPNAVNSNQQTLNGLNGYISMYQYKASSSDINLFDNDKFVHGSLETGANRTSEEITLFRDDTDKEGIKYKVRKGQSLLYNTFKIWRELSLLENSVLLNRVTKSAIVRLISVEVGDMAQENVGPYLQRIKMLMEQKSALNVNESIQEYTNPGPIENNIYIPTYNGKGTITTSQVGGDVDVGQLPDLKYFQDALFGSLRAPKQYFGRVDDAAGFSGGESLALISSRYAKAIKRIQNALIQPLTTAINLLLLDKGLTSYVNDFTLHMQVPTTKEEIDRRDNVSSKIQIVSDIMNLVSDLEDNTSKLKILKSLLSNVITDVDVIALLEQEIQKLEDTSKQTEPESSNIEEGDFNEPINDFDQPLDLDWAIGLDEVPSENEEEFEEPLPTPEETGIDMTNNNQD